MEQAAAGKSVEGSWGTSSNAQQPPTAVAIRKRLSMTAVNAPPPSAVQPYLQGQAVGAFCSHSISQKAEILNYLERKQGTISRVLNKEASANNISVRSEDWRHSGSPTQSPVVLAAKSSCPVFACTAGNSISRGKDGKAPSVLSICGQLEQPSTSILPQQKFDCSLTTAAAAPAGDGGLPVLQDSSHQHHHHHCLAPNRHPTTLRETISARLSLAAAVNNGGAESSGRIHDHVSDVRAMLLEEGRARRTSAMAAARVSAHTSSLGSAAMARKQSAAFYPSAYDDSSSRAMLCAHNTSTESGHLQVDMSNNRTYSTAAGAAAVAAAAADQVAGRASRVLDLNQDEADCAELSNVSTLTSSSSGDNSSDSSEECCENAVRGLPRYSRRLGHQLTRRPTVSKQLMQLKRNSSLSSFKQQSVASTGSRNDRAAGRFWRRSSSSSSSSDCMAKRHSGSSRITGSVSSAWQDLRTHQSSDGDVAEGSYRTQHPTKATHGVRKPSSFTVLPRSNQRRCSAASMSSSLVSRASSNCSSSSSGTGGSCLHDSITDNAEKVVHKFAIRKRTSSIAARAANSMAKSLAEVRRSRPAASGRSPPISVTAGKLTLKRLSHRVSVTSSSGMTRSKRFTTSDDGDAAQHRASWMSTAASVAGSNQRSGRRVELPSWSGSGARVSRYSCLPGARRSSCFNSSHLTSSPGPALADSGLAEVIRPVAFRRSTRASSRPLSVSSLCSGPPHPHNRRSERSHIKYQCKQTTALAIAAGAAKRASKKVHSIAASEAPAAAGVLQPVEDTTGRSRAVSLAQQQKLWVAGVMRRLSVVTAAP